VKVRGPDTTGEREQIYDFLEGLAAQREREERGRGLTNIVRQMNYVENHVLPAVAEKYPALVKRVLGRQRWQELKDEQEERMSSANDISRELVSVARELVAVRSPFMVVKTLQLKREGATRDSLENARRILDAGYILKGGSFTFDSNRADWETWAQFRWSVDDSIVDYVFKGFSFGYSGEGPRGLETFLKMFHWNPDPDKIFRNQFGMEKGSVPLTAFR